MGEVYRARDTKLGREIALKVLPDELASRRGWLERFEQEARLASSLNHPNIVTIYEIGQAGATHYIAMELVEGQTLRTLLERGPLPLERALTIAAQMADGLAKAHGAQVVHRDLKPENVMVTREGLVKILDFGLGRLGPAFAESDSRVNTTEFLGARTHPGTILGTAHYMSPEQAAGRSTDYRSDQFAFGLLLYEMVAGKSAFRRPTPVQSMAAIIAEEPAPLATLNPRVPERVRVIIERCLGKDPDKRYDSTLDLARDVRLALGATSGTASAAMVPPGPVRLRRRRLWLASTVSAVGLAAVVAVSLTPLGNRLFRHAELEPLPKKKNVAVLPFRFTGTTPDMQASADGLSATLSAMLARLATIPELQVAPPDEVRADRLDSAATARRDLSANLVLTGTIDIGTGVRVDTVLLDTLSSHPLRGGTLTASLSDPFAVLDRLLTVVVDMLEVNIPAAARQRLVDRDTANPEAALQQLRGRGYLQSFEKPESIESAIAAFDRAAKLDTQYARALAGLGEAYWRKYEHTRDPAWTGSAVASCTRALSLNGRLAAAHVCLGRIYNGTGRYQEAIAEFQQTLAAEPTNDEAYAGLGRAQQELDRFDEAEQTYLHAIALRPQYWVYYNQLGAFYFKRGRYADAAERFAQVVTFAADSFRGYGNLGGAYVQLGRYEDAIQALERSVAIRPTAPSQSNLGTAYFNRGRFGEAARAFEAATQLSPTNYELWGNLADAYHWSERQRGLASTAYDKAITLGLTELTVNPRNEAVLIDVANYYAMTGKSREARDFMARAQKVAPLDGFVQFRTAMALDQLGEPGRALDALERARRAGFSLVVIRDTPNFNNLWSEPRWKNLLRGQ
jgi:serine/threonine-protein kinase